MTFFEVFGELKLGIVNKNSGELANVALRNTRPSKDV